MHQAKTLPPDLRASISGYRVDQPFPELVEAVRASLTGIEQLLARYEHDAIDFDRHVNWVVDLQKWRDDLFLAAGYMSAAGYDVPWDLELRPSPATFIQTWRELLTKAWAVLQPSQAGRLHRVQ